MEEKHTPAGEERERLSYGGNRLPWWLLIPWIAFVGWGAWYLIVHFGPNLLAWLSGEPGVR